MMTTEKDNIPRVIDVWVEQEPTAINDGLSIMNQYVSSSTWQTQEFVFLFSLRSGLVQVWSVDGIGFKVVA